MDVRRLLREPPAFLGRRGAVLVIIGLVWIMQGIGIVVAGDPPTPTDAALLHLQIPIVIRVLLWAVTGTIAICGALLNRPNWEGMGFMALVAMPLERALSYGWSWLVYVGTWGDIGYGRSWVGAISWAAVVVLIVTIAGWREDPRTGTTIGGTDG